MSIKSLKLKIFINLHSILICIKKKKKLKMQEISL